MHNPQKTPPPFISRCQISIYSNRNLYLSDQTDTKLDMHWDYKKS